MILFYCDTFRYGLHKVKQSMVMRRGSSEEGLWAALGFLAQNGKQMYYHDNQMLLFLK